MNPTTCILNQVFLKSTFSKLIAGEDCPVFTEVLNRYVRNSEGKTNGECISSIYRVLGKSYRNEYFFKNTLLNRLLSTKPHDISNTMALRELPIAKSKADFILINGEAVVYEIKTGMDSLVRLRSQLEDYYKAFSKVVVVTEPGMSDEVLTFLDGTPTGVSVIDRSVIKCVKPPVEDRTSLNLETMFRILRKTEFETLIKTEFGYLPATTAAKYYDACFELFNKIDVEKAYGLFTRTLKGRCHIAKDLYLKVPKELRFLVYFSEYKESDYIKLDSFLAAKED